MRIEAITQLIEDWAHDYLDKGHKKPNETHRWLFCWNGETEVFDCACCLTREPLECGCICHERIASLAKFLSERLV